MNTTNKFQTSVHSNFLQINTDDAQARRLQLDLESETGPVGQLVIELDIDTQPFICKFFQQLSASTKTRHVQSKLIKEKIQPNYLDCYC